MKFKSEAVHFETILPIWTHSLWPDRKSQIKHMSSMTYEGKIDMSIYKKYTPLKFIIFSIILWLINSTGIYFINIFIDNKNISAILVIPFIALISYTIQKKYIFN